MQRYSQKREAILACLRNTKEHPSAEWIYQKLKPVYPSLSLATVYRNLNQLKEEGLIRSMGFVRGQERFDANTVPHTHAVCRRCGKILDLESIDLPSDLIDEVQKASGFAVWNAELSFSGICPACTEEDER